MKRAVFTVFLGVPLAGFVWIGLLFSCEGPSCRGLYSFILLHIPLPILGAGTLVAVLLAVWWFSGLLFRDER